MTEEEKNAQYTGFSVVHGHIGYLREAYHGDPYPSHALMPEAFEWEPPAGLSEDELDALYDANQCGAEIPASTMADRIELVAKLAEERERTIYSETNEANIKATIKSYVDFVELAKVKEAEQGHPCRVYASY